MTPFTPDLLECLAAIVEEGGFERAAKRLSVTQSAVSQRLHSLETLAGTVLIVRGRPLRPTPAGRILLRHAMQMRLLHTDLEVDLRKLSPSATGSNRNQERISIAVNADSIATWALPAFDSLVGEGLPLEIIADDQDFTQDWLREGQVLGCVTTLAQAMRGSRSKVSLLQWKQERLDMRLLDDSAWLMYCYPRLRELGMEAEFVGPVVVDLFGVNELFDDILVSSTTQETTA